MYTTTSLNYLVTLIVKADCGMYDTLSYKLSSISLGEVSESRISVYPNPADDRITVVTNNHKLREQDLQWYDLSGKRLNVPAARVSEGHFSFDVSALPAGDYLLVYSADEGGVVKVTVK